MQKPSNALAVVDVGYGYGRSLELGFEAAAQQAREVLKPEGFAAPCEINTRDKLKEKLGVEFANHLLPGARKPLLAYHALQHEMNLGLLLPCNVVVGEKEGESSVAAIDAAKMLSLVGNPALESDRVRGQRKAAAGR